MKKIISALALTSLVFGAAFADAKVSLNYRTQATLFKGQKDGDKDMVMDILNLQSKAGRKAGLAAPTDTLKFSASNDVAGVTFAVIPTGMGGTDFDNVSEYSAFLKLGPVELGAGRWKDGKSIGAYQLKNDADAGNHDGSLFAMYKLGNMKKGSLTTFIDDVTNFAGGSNTLSGYAKFTGETVNMSYALTGALIQDTSKGGDATKAWSASGLQSKTAFALQGNFMWERVNFMVNVKSYMKDAMALGAHFLFKTSEKSTLVAGLTTDLNFAKYGSKNEDGDMATLFTECSIDLRYRYANGGFSFTSLNNFSHLEAGAELAKGVGGLAAPKGVKNAMWNTLAIRYKMSGSVTAFAQWIDLFVFGDEGKTVGQQIGINPGLQFYAANNASIAVGVSYALGGIGKDGDNTLTHLIRIPCILRVKM